MIQTPCSPAATSLDIDFIDKWRMSTMERKQSEFKALCLDCPVQADCLKQGQWVNLDNDRVYLDGIFGGMTAAERKGLGL